MREYQAESSGEAVTGAVFAGVMMIRSARDAQQR